MNNGVSKQRPTEGAAKKDTENAITELKETHHYFTRMNVNGYVAEPEIIVRTPTLQRKIYLDDDSLSLSSNEATATPAVVKQPANKLKRTAKKPALSTISNTSSSGDEWKLYRPMSPHKSPYEEMPLNWRRTDKPDKPEKPDKPDKPTPDKKQQRPKSEILPPRSPSPEMVFQVLPPKPWPPHGP